VSFPIENPGRPDDYIDGLPRREMPDWRTSSPDEYTPVSVTTNPPHPTKGVDTGLFGPVKCLVYGALVVVGMAIHAIWLAPEPASTNVPTEPGITMQATPAPVVTTTKTTLSKACERALVSMSEILDSAVTIAGVNEKQLDIMAETRQAIVAKDFRRINELEEQQRALDDSLIKHHIRVLPKVTQIKKDLAECQSQS
jgi:hypothetical protein